MWLLLQVAAAGATKAASTVAAGAVKAANTVAAGAAAHAAGVANTAAGAAPGPAAAGAAAGTAPAAAGAAAAALPAAGAAAAPHAAGMNLWSILLNAHPVSKMVFAMLILSSVLSIAVIVERWIVLQRARRSTRNAVALLDHWAQTRQMDVAREEIGKADRGIAPLFSVLRAGIALWEQLVTVGETRVEVMEAMVQEAVGRELKLVRAGMRTNLPILANIASVAPFIGLFGTVVGIIMTFNAIAEKGNMGQDVVGSGIADALVATAMGLFAAIPAVIAYNFFTDQISQLVMSIEEVAMERIYFLVQRDPVCEQVATRRN